MIRKKLKKIFTVSIIFFSLSLNTTYACGVTCKEGVCTETSCGTNCGCGCKQKFWQKWQFWTVVGAVAVLSLVIGLSSKNNMEKVPVKRK